MLIYLCSLDVDLWLTSFFGYFTWLFILFYFIESALPSHVWKLHQLILSTSAFTQWGQLIVMLTYHVRERSPGQIVSSSHDITVSHVIDSRPFFYISLVHKISAAILNISVASYDHYLLGCKYFYSKYLDSNIKFYCLKHIEHN